MGAYGCSAQTAVAVLSDVSAMKGETDHSIDHPHCVTQIAHTLLIITRAVLFYTNPSGTQNTVIYVAGTVHESGGKAGRIGAAPILGFLEAASLGEPDSHDRPSHPARRFESCRPLPRCDQMLLFQSPVSAHSLYHHGKLDATTRIAYRESSHRPWTKAK